MGYWICGYASAASQHGFGRSSIDRAIGYVSAGHPIFYPGRPNGHGRAPKVFWGGERRQGQVGRSFEASRWALNLMGDWCGSVGSATGKRENKGAYRPDIPGEAPLEKTNSWEFFRMNCCHLTTVG